MLCAGVSGCPSCSTEIGDFVPQALNLPVVDDPTSAAHGRVYQLALAMRRNFGIKLTLNSRVFRDSRQVDLRAAAEQDAAAPDAEKVFADVHATCHPSRQPLRTA